MPAIEPPPAPISIMSITGALIGRPEPRLKRCTRAASIIEATSMRPSSTRQALAVVPPMSKEITLVLAGELAEQRGRKPAAGRAGLEQPDREFARRRGRDEAAGRMHQPQRAAKPRAASSRSRFAR